MQRKAYVPGVAVLLAALLAACTGSDDSSSQDDPRPGEATASATVAQPGRYDTLPEPCGAIDHDTLDTLLPGIRQLPGAAQREQAYEGEATQTYDTDAKAGCRWKVESADATHYVFVDFERVVSWDNAVSDDSKAQEVYGGKVEAADLPEPTPTDSEEESEGTDEESDEPAQTGASTAEPSASPSASASRSASPSASSSSPSASGTPASLLPRTLDGLGDEAFLDDALGTSKQRTVTVVFRTSNVIVTVEYEEQPATTTVVPDSEELQDRARNLAERLADAFDD
ncbi:hypothetical protein [Streptomyces europaeiscabiei]|uniref:hypothetical protein n=1 Tax=Streptomyces europaeiscabiei TaxID=146819 RepID=UPI0007658B0C|nr:hypothetical protein [Streptomyces europaeiscabiei]MDX2530720.1 DUF3558 domain-containing protein [Streptomyces europaeiscabiei]MDX3671590.1 DUF3558 domain-containing protein [Streptomyces europaeiscabiei]MDX3784459.1 DUF3558 domain-containing protein [Streptomyces europaeiscabiei]MDX3838828.1 DUF3558 domain-containing protein [Streptomyces europaeiscabiei]MDX3848291.1 DUF3558 domain-containing protein [Streptomyces europaeiscabiei]